MSDPFKSFREGSKQEIDVLLTFFLSECPASMIPSVDQVRQWGKILYQRGPEFRPYAEACLRWPNDEP
ncbi:hypothetical protein D3C81_807940 [compost metagenome]